ncbi:ribosomal RNA small subunit methyltransferase E [Gracilibacillus boraciitolerans JCM 21714]|uniref:Ribosomal RNA small subunit methyltransferase E n=1 Tax=Gracilibacillus boraciitolerans JCM 21714 TaxID=1298598 RepID=W4VEA1_9BACI|nr:16S rRNA (uracil(1498)-N(3))-methyltransferase [Gracilibacillus boraciitolerans]GAE91143.1 ribosomal RNA small subunit methyltransferase E [Gracilibacillus boraciitolerans JCM 21714]
MQRYFISKDNWQDHSLQVLEDDYHHIVHVMRMTIDDQFIGNRYDGQSAVCKIIAISDDAVEAIVIEWLTETTELPISITIAQGLPKGDKWEFILQKGTELGAKHFIPFQSSRSVVKWDSKKLKNKLPRWQKIVKEASEQAHRTKVPTVDSVLSITDIINASCDYDWKFFAYEETTRAYHASKLYDYISKVNKGQSVLVCIGPEGGFSENEASQLKHAGFDAIRLGPRILRTETAPLYVLANLSFYFEEMR